MKIAGDCDSSEFRHYLKEPGILYGSNDVLKGKTETNRVIESSGLFGRREYNRITDRKLYLHIPTNAWSRFTGFLREYCLPWRWKAAYLDREDGTKCSRILVCPSIGNISLPDHLSQLLGKPWVDLQAEGNYEEVIGNEYIRDIRETSSSCEQRFTNILGDLHIDHGKPLYHIFRARGILSSLKYSFLNRFSNSWKEVSVQTAYVSEKILIKKSDEEPLSQLGMIRSAAS